VSDNSYQHAGSDAFTLRPFLFLLSLSTLLALLWVFFSGGLIEVIEGSLLLVFFAFTVIVGLSAAFRWRWRRPISIILGASRRRCILSGRLLGLCSGTPNLSL
jgi:hypothetical protein